MGGPHDGLLDVGGAGGSRDHVHRARHVALAHEVAQLRPCLLVAGKEGGGFEQHDMGFGQEVERRRIVGARNLHDGAGLRDAGEGMGNRGAVGVHRRAFRHLQRAATMPGKRRQQRVSAAAHHGRKVAIAQVDRDRLRHLVHVVDQLHRAAHRLHHLGEDADAVVEIALPAQRDQVAPVLGDMPLHRLAARAFGALGQLGAHARHDVFARRHERRSFHIWWKVLPWGAGRSRNSVQPDAKGTLFKRPLPKAWLASTRAAKAVALR